MGLKAIILDTNEKELEESLRFLNSTCKFEEVRCYTESRHVMQHIQERDCNFLFTEIELDKTNAFELAKICSAKELKMCFIILTKNMGFGTEAFTYGISDYIAKPLNEKAVERVIARFDRGDYFKGV